MGSAKASFVCAKVQLRPTATHAFFARRMRVLPSWQSTCGRLQCANKVENIAANGRSGANSSIRTSHCAEELFANASRTTHRPTPARVTGFGVDMNPLLLPVTETTQ